jgi:hypothetical protein
MNPKNNKTVMTKTSKRKGSYTPVSEVVETFIGEYKEPKENIVEYPYPVNSIREISNESATSYSADKTDDLKINLTAGDLQRAFIYSEIINKPKCKRRGRWR